MTTKPDRVCWPFFHSWTGYAAPWREDAADHETRMLDAMRAAIAKAKGQP